MRGKIKAWAWVEELANESNLWLSAVKAEGGEEFNSAITFYLKDAKRCLEEGWMTRAALSCSCTANCLMKVGLTDEAHRVYAEAGAIYVEHANNIISNSIREALWSLHQAYISYNSAQEQYNAQTVYDQYVSIASKVSPFYNTKERVDLVDFTKRSPLNISNTSIQQLSSSDLQNFPLSQEAKVAIEKFFIERRDNNDGVQKKTAV